MNELNVLLSFLKRQGKKLDSQLVASALSLLKGEQAKGIAGVNVVINLLMGESRRKPAKISRPEDDILSQAVQNPAMKKFVDRTASV